MGRVTAGWLDDSCHLRLDLICDLAIAGDRPESEDDVGGDRVRSAEERRRHQGELRAVLRSPQPQQPHWRQTIGRWEHASSHQWRRCRCCR